MLKFMLGLIAKTTGGVWLVAKTRVISFLGIFFFFWVETGFYLANKRVNTTPSAGPWAHSRVLPRPAKSFT